MILIDTSLCKSMYVYPIRVKVVGRNGYRLRIETYTIYNETVVLLQMPLLTGEEPGYYEEKDITADEQEFTYNVLTYSPAVTSAYMVVAKVLDAEGNVVESTIAYIVHAVNRDTFTAEKDTYVYVFINGLAAVRYVYKAGEAVVVPKAAGLTVLVWYEGRLMVYADGNKLSDVFGKTAIVTLRLGIKRDIAKALVRYVDDPNVASVVYKAPEIADAVGAVAWIRNLFMEHKWDVLVKEISADENYIYLSLRIIADIGSPIDWLWSPSLLTLITGGAIIAVGVLTANPALAALGAGIIVGVIEVTALTKSSAESLDEIKREAESTIQSFNQSAQTWRGDLEAYLDQLVQQGKITEDDKNRILSYFDQVVQEANTAMEKLKDMIDKAYWNGYNAGVESQKGWILVAGVAGFAIGYIVGSR